MAPTGDYGDQEHYPDISRRTSKVLSPHLCESDHQVSPPFMRSKSKRTGAMGMPSDQEEPFVTEAVPYEVKERAVQKRMKAVTALQDLMAGKLPTNEQIMALIDRMRTSQAVAEGRSRMSPEGMK